MSCNVSQWAGTMLGALLICGTERNFCGTFRSVPHTKMRNDYAVFKNLVQQPSMACMCVTLRNSMIMAYMHVYHIANPRNCITVVPSC